MNTTDDFPPVDGAAEIIKYAKVLVVGGIISVLLFFALIFYILTSLL